MNRSAGERVTSEGNHNRHGVQLPILLPNRHRAATGDAVPRCRMERNPRRLLTAPTRLTTQDPGGTVPLSSFRSFMSPLKKGNGFSQRLSF